jgi:hypothetical protein
LIVSRNDGDRDFATLKFDANGEITGNWNCNYTHQEREYDFSSSYKGNIVADREFSDEDGSDETKLFFIVKGTYKQTVYHVDIGDKITEGIVYLTGWVDPDKSMEGILTITTDDITDKDKWAASYELVAPAIE